MVVTGVWKQVWNKKHSKEKVSLEFPAGVQLKQPPEIPVSSLCGAKKQITSVQTEELIQQHHNDSKSIVFTPTMFFVFHMDGFFTSLTYRIGRRKKDPDVPSNQ